MIVRNLTIKIQGNRATTDSPLYLHTQDKNIHIAINVVNSKFEIKDNMLLSFTIIKPNGEEVDKADCYIKNKQCHLLLNGAEFDEETEVGTHLVQMKLYDEFRQARLSLPPFAMHVLKSSGEFYADDEIEGIQAEQNAYKLMTENRLALEMNESILISDLPTTTEVAGYVPVTNGDTTYKLDMSQVATKEELEHNHDTVYAPKEHVHSQYITEHQSLEHLALKEHTHTEYAQKEHEHSQYLTEHQDISHLASKAYVSNEIANAQLNGGGGSGEIDLSGYATKDDLLVKADKEHTHSQYLTQHQDISHLATKAELAHNHDNQYAPKEHTHEQYLTEHQDISHLALKTEIPSLDGYATEQYVTTAIANAQLGGEEVDLTGYALKTDLPTHTSDLTNDSGFITEVPSEYVTDEELQAKGYLTSHQDISHLATKTELNGMVTSTSITRIELVDELPSTQEQGVLYIVKAGE